jgi:hypothetical protein
MGLVYQYGEAVTKRVRLAATEGCRKCLGGWKSLLGGNNRQSKEENIKELGF